MTSKSNSLLNPFGITCVAFLFLLATGCRTPSKQENKSSPQGILKISGSMQRVMLMGELSGTIDIDTISSKEHVYGIGPIEYLKGEIMLWDGQSYYSKVTSDLQMKVDSGYQIKAPFFVYTNVDSWKEFNLPDSVIDNLKLEDYLVKLSKDHSPPFVFKISGVIDSASIHVVNLPDGTVVRSPKEAHTGQRDFVVADEMVYIVGFFSMEHQGIFTHHTSYVHMHLLTSTKKSMGHVDKLHFKNGSTKLYLPG
jgi:acetolactate decarboxylase